MFNLKKYKEGMEILSRFLKDADQNLSGHSREGLKALTVNSGPFVYKSRNGFVDFLAGYRIGNIKVKNVKQEKSFYDAVNEFFKTYHLLFGLKPEFPELAGEFPVQGKGYYKIKFSQRIENVAVKDSLFTIFFDTEGYIFQVTGRPFSTEELKIDTNPGLTKEGAENIAKENIRKEFESGNTKLALSQFQFSSRLVVSGRLKCLMWEIMADSDKYLYLKRFRINAKTGNIIQIDNLVFDSTRSIPLRKYSHANGILDTEEHEVIQINVDAEERRRWFGLKQYRYALQRLGSGRARIWNANHNNGEPPYPRTWTAWEYSWRSIARNYFQIIPGESVNRIFNEQQTYYYAQLLKTYIDEWGRRPNDLSYYPVEADRQINVEIIVNTMLPSRNVMHGCFKNNLNASEFDCYPGDRATVPTVFFYNTPSRSTSPQFIGPEQSGSYSIIVHEIMHWLSWQYGSWNSPTGTKDAASFSEGYSMVAPCLLGKRKWPELAYDQSENVTTGSFAGPSATQWKHHSDTNPAFRYAEMDCRAEVGDNHYFIAWPFVQAMWKLMNNQSNETGNPLFADHDSAVKSVADWFMFPLFNYTNDETMTWDKLITGLSEYIVQRASEDCDWGFISFAESLLKIYSVFSSHGLFSPSKN